MPEWKNIPVYCFSRLLFWFQYKLDQRTSIHIDDGNDSKAGLSDCSGHNESFGYGIIEIWY